MINNEINIDLTPGSYIFRFGIIENVNAQTNTPTKVVYMVSELRLLAFEYAKVKLNVQMMAISERRGNQKSLAVLYLLAWKEQNKRL